jgi:hypothetical protein
MLKLFLIALSVLIATGNPVIAQTTTTETETDPALIIENLISLNRAKNLARMAAEQANGGLSKYRAESSMHGPAINAPFVENEDGTLTFTILGRRPESSEYTIETVVTVAKDASVVNVDYNGPIRNQNLSN